MTLQEYLEARLGEMAQADPNFRERYEDKEKSMQDCIRYITEQAQKQAVDKCAAISDDDVLQMAVHYYQEKEVKPTGNVVAKVVASTPVAKEEATPKKGAVLVPKIQQPVKKTKKKKKIVDNSLQLDLFGGM